MTRAVTVCDVQCVPCAVTDFRASCFVLSPCASVLSAVRGHWVCLGLPPGAGRGGGGQVRRGPSRRPPPNDAVESGCVAAGTDVAQSDAVVY